MAAEALRSEFLCSLTGLVAPQRDIGTTPRGTRRFFPAIGGSFEGPRLRGEVLPDGGDWLLTRPDGVLEQDVRITLKTDDGAFNYVRYAGMRHGPPEVMAHWHRVRQSIRANIISALPRYSRLEPSATRGSTRSWLWGWARDSRRTWFDTRFSRYCKWPYESCIPSCAKRRRPNPFRRVVLRPVDHTPLLPNPQRSRPKRHKPRTGCVGPVPLYAARTGDLGPGDFVKVHPPRAGTRHC